MISSAILRSGAVAAGTLMASVLAVSAAQAHGGESESSVPSPRMERMHELHMQGNPGMERMHELHMQGNPGMERMHELHMQHRDGLHSKGMQRHGGGGRTR